jgi:quercetin dioxygenase-like cupin family protein
VVVGGEAGGLAPLQEVRLLCRPAALWMQARDIILGGNKLTKKLAALFCVSIIASTGIGYAADHEMSGMKPFDQLEWQDVPPDFALKMAVVSGDPATGENVRMLRLPPGYVVPTHKHTNDYHAVNLTGIWRHWDDGGEKVDLPTGSSVFQPGQVMHGDACVGPEECIIWVYQPAAADFILKEE